MIRAIFLFLYRIWCGLAYLLERYFLRRAKYDTVNILLKGRMLEIPLVIPKWFMKEPPGKPLVHTLAMLRAIAKDEKVKRVIIRIKPVAAGWSQVQAIAREITAIREAGKETVAYLERGGNREYFLAAHCEKVIVPPAATVMLIGIMLESTHVKELLDKFDVAPNFYSVGKYKNAMETFTRRSPSKPAKEIIDNLAMGVYEQLVGGIARARNLDPDQVKKIIDAGPYLAAEAKEAGLVDEIMYYDDFREQLKKERPRPNIITARSYQRFFSSYNKHRAVIADRGLIALVVVQGGITEGGQQETSAASDKLCATLRKIGDDSRFKAVVLRVVSPGGSSLASDLIWGTLNKVKAKKPVIVSMGDVAASGGYYIAMAGEEIFVEPGTITGSIGVISGKFNLRGLYKKIGVNKEQTKRGENAGIFTDYAAFSAGERERITKLMETFYVDFKEKVAEGRSIAVEQVEELAQGRVYLGDEALEKGLVDRVGGVIDALEMAKEKMRLDKDDPVRIAVFPRPKNAWLRMIPRVAGRIEIEEKLPAPIAEIFSDMRELESFDGTPQFRLPYMVKFR